jgi:methionyl-tRNA synthetase
MAKARNILVTSALPYANGSIHIGHLVEYIQTDIWVRFQRLVGNTVLYVCGDDAHGTPIMLKAKQQGVEPEAFIAQMQAEHKEDFARFGVGFDHYGSTNAPLNKELCELIYERVKAAGFLSRKEIEQFYDPESKAFLADRFIKGTCPFCKTPDQYGDGCEVCGHTYSPTELIEPKSVFSGATPVLRKSEHIFLQLEPARQFLLDLYTKGFVDESLVNKLKEWFNEPLRDWDISRDERFFGFRIPGETGKYFFNWFDAPIGYLASLGDHLKEGSAGVEEYWNNPHMEVFHFIGKDILYFHALFWPAMLNAAKFRVPTKLAVHGHLTVNGKKMSKRDGTFIKGSTFAKHLDPQYLRYYYATKLGPTPEDLDLSFEDLGARVNGELVNKLANLVSRCAPMLSRLLEGKLGVSAMDAIPLLKEIRAAEGAIAEAFDSRNFAAATRTICALADKANKYVEDQAPWKLVKADAEGARGVLTAALEAGRILTIYLKPILPEFAAKVEKCLGLPAQNWKNVQDAMEPRTIAPFEHLVQRLETKAVDAMIEESKEKQEAGSKKQEATGAAQSATGGGATPPAGGHADDEALAATIDINAFAAVDLRVAKVLTAEPVEKSDKLMKLTLDAGHLGQRTILAGIKKAYTPDRLVGRLVIFCANLAPRTMGKFGTSEGMICAAGPGGADVFVLSPDSGAKPGQRIH